MSPITSASIKAIVLWVFTQEGCRACTVAKGHLDKFATAHPDVLIMPLNVTKRDWTISGFSPVSTPAYLFTANRTALHNHEGILTDKALANIVRDLQEG
jgi:hypothetical protein